MYKTHHMIRIQLHLTPQQDRALRSLAKVQGVSRADLIRRAIDLMLSRRSGEGDALEELIGAAGPAGRRDLSERHDQVLYSADTPLDVPKAAEP